MPALWFLEVANALLVLVRRGKLIEADRTAALTALAGLRPRVDVEGSSLAFTTISSLASKHRLTVYDATYLELAIRVDLPLACGDTALRAAAKRVHVRVL